MKSLVVHDEFYKDPWAVRDFALRKAAFLNNKQTPNGFSGTETVQSYFSQSLIKRIEVLVGEKIVVDPRHFSFGVFAKTYANDSGRQVIHVDSTVWTGILYLSKPEDCAGGTHLYRHKATGWDRIPGADEMSRSGYTDREDFQNRFLRPIGGDFDQWEPNLSVAMKFNRLVLFRAGECFHGSGASFGTDDETCRLIQLFFFNTQRGVA